MSADPAATGTQKAPPDGPRSSGSATSVHRQPRDPLGLQDPGPVGAEQPHWEPVVDVERLPVDPQGEDGVGVGGVAGVELAAPVATLGLERLDVDGPIGAVGPCRSQQVADAYPGPRGGGAPALDA